MRDEEIKMTDTPPSIAVVMLNWNGEEDSLACIEALHAQTMAHTIIAVDNGSSDNFAEKVASKYPHVTLLRNHKNLGFAGGVNTGIRYAMQHGCAYVALINNDATPENTWLEQLYLYAEKDTNVGIVTGKLLKTDGLIDSTGDMYTTWGLAYPRGRNEPDNGQYSTPEYVFGASGGASMYRVHMLEDIGLFDEDFFAYYEDVDLSFRAQLAGWRVAYVPTAVAHHKVGASSSKIPGFTTYMTIKNLPWLLWKNTPWRIIPTILPRFCIAHLALIISALSKGTIIPVLKGVFFAYLLFPKKLIQRHHIKHNTKVSVAYITSIITYDLPPNAHKLMAVRAVLRRMRFWR